MPLLVCPNDGTGMKEVNRNGVLIDICPECRGVWLDRGELEKLLTLVEARDEAPERGEPRYDRDRDDDRRYDDRDYKGKPYRKKRSLLDFFDL